MSRKMSAAAAAAAALVVFVAGGGVCALFFGAGLIYSVVNGQLAAWQQFSRAAWWNWRLGRLSEEPTEIGKEKEYTVSRESGLGFFPHRLVGDYVVQGGIG